MYLNDLLLFNVPNGCCHDFDHHFNGECHEFYWHFICGWQEFIIFASQGLRLKDPPTPLRQSWL